jgi:hypothetical protein
MRMAGEGGLVAMGWNVIAEMGITQIWWLAPFPMGITQIWWLAPFPSVPDCPETALHLSHQSAKP